jgi:hypothetical protein
VIRLPRSFLWFFTLACGMGAFIYYYCILIEWIQGLKALLALVDRQDISCAPFELYDFHAIFPIVGLVWSVDYGR